MTNEEQSRIEYAIEFTWGERCPDFDLECSTCLAWQEWDNLRAMSWRPIEEAPKDGTYILIAIEKPCHVSGGRVSESWWNGDGFYHPWTNAKPTHWMPLPQPPEPTDD